MIETFFICSRFGEQRGPIVPELRPPVELENPRLQALGVSSVGTLAAEAVDEPQIPSLAVTPQEAEHMAAAKLQELPCFARREVSFDDFLDHAEVIAFLLAHHQIVAHREDSALWGESQDAAW